MLQKLNRIFLWWSLSDDVLISYSLWRVTFVCVSRNHLLILISIQICNVMIKIKSIDFYLEANFHLISIYMTFDGVVIFTWRHRASSNSERTIQARFVFVSSDPPELRGNDTLGRGFCYGRQETGLHGRRSKKERVTRLCHKREMEDHLDNVHVIRDPRRDFIAR